MSIQWSDLSNFLIYFRSHCYVFGLSVVQPSGRIKYAERKSSITVESMQIENQDTVYLPVGLGGLFKSLKYLKIINSRLRFIEKWNFEDLENLLQLIIQSNPMTHIPHDAFSPLKGLQYLEISSCNLKKLHGELLAQNTFLRFLNITGNHLDSLPSVLLKNNLRLEIFDATNNRLKFIDDQLFSNLRSLNYISLSENLIQKVSVNAFNSSTSLRALGLSVNRLRSLHADTFTNNMALEMCYLLLNEIDDFPPGLFRNNLRLETVILEKNKVKLLHSKLLDKLMNLKTLSLSGMSISQLPFDIFFTLKNYERCLIDDNDLEVLHKDLLSRNLNLVYFGASFNKIVKLDPTFFRNNLKLREIYLTHNQIKTIDQDLFKGLKHVMKIVLSYNLIESITASTFANLSNLRELHLNGNYLDKLNQDLLVQNLPISRLLLDLKEIAPLKVGSMNNRNFSNMILDDYKETKVDLKICGLKVNASGLIVGGKATEINEWPWLASLFKSESKEFFCGGSIVSERHVLTAAHCVSDKRKKIRRSPRDVLAYLGKHNLSAIEANSKWFHPHDILIHPDWDDNEVRWDADLAILVADAPIEFSSTIMPVCLPYWTEEFEENNFDGIVVGWGGSEETMRLRHTEVPYKVNVLTVPSAKCYGDVYKLAEVGSPRTFCAIGVEEDSGPCKGDSG